MDKIPISFTRPVERTKFCRAPHHHNISNTQREIPIHLTALWDICNAHMSTGFRAKDIHLARRRSQHSGNDFEQSAFAGAVWAHHRNAFTFMEMEGYIIERNMTVITHCKTLNIKDGLIGLVVCVWIHFIMFPNRIISFMAGEPRPYERLFKSFNNPRYVMLHHINIGPGGWAISERLKIQIIDDLHTC